MVQTGIFNYASNNITISRSQDQKIQQQDNVPTQPDIGLYAGYIFSYSNNFLLDADNISNSIKGTPNDPVTENIISASYRGCSPQI